MKIQFKNEEPYYGITVCNHTDMPIIPMKGDIIWLDGTKHEVVRREFDLNSSTGESYVDVYVKDAL